MARVGSEKPRSTESTTWRPLVAGPLRQIDRVRREMNRLWEDFFTETPARKGEVSEFRTRFPEFDLSETADEFILRAEIPGMTPNDLDISFVKNTVRIKGEKKQHVEEKDETYHVVGRSYGTFYRSIPLPAEVDGDKVSASYKDGILTLVLPKSEEARGKRIEVKFEDQPSGG